VSFANGIAGELGLNCLFYAKKILEQHPITNMLDAPGEDDCIKEDPLNICNSYFSKEWIESGGMHYMVIKAYKYRTFINYTHSLSEIWMVCV
jgi:hypothetical protein